MRIYLENGELAEITVKQGKNEHIYEYYIGSIKIGVLNDKIMENNILILEDSIKEPKIAEEIKEKQEGIEPSSPKYARYSTIKPLFLS